MHLKLFSQDRQFLLEFKSGGWVMMLLFLVIGIGPLWIGDHYGEGWRLVSAVAGLVLWMALRPWQLGLLTPQSRRTSFLLSVIYLAGFIINAAISYWKI